MFASRAFITPVARAAFRPQTIRFAARATSIRGQLASNSIISQVITEDHRKIEQYYKEVINNPDDIDQTRYGNQFTWGLARHSVAEAFLIYPAFEKYMGEFRKETAEWDRKHHHQARQNV